MSALEGLLYGANPEMITIDQVRASNAQAEQLRDLVVVFVGGTNGIGESTVRELFLRTTAPRAYIVGRNEERGKALVDRLHRTNPTGRAFFIQKDITLIHNVDELCADLLSRESKIHCLFLTAGFMAFKGRSETREGMDRKMAVNYYARVRCTLKMMPALQAAADANELSRVITVLAAGSEADVDVEDLDLRRHFTLQACLAHCVVMTDFAIEELARRYPKISFSHSYPGTVKTGIANQLSGPVRLAVKLFYAVMTPWILDVRESGERHFFQMTSQCYPAAAYGAFRRKAKDDINDLPLSPEGADHDDEDMDDEEDEEEGDNRDEDVEDGERTPKPAKNDSPTDTSSSSSRISAAGVPCPQGLGPIKGTDGVPGSGAYLLDWDGKATGDQDILNKFRGREMSRLVWDHTMSMFEGAERAHRLKRSADEALTREARNPPGWRPA